MFTGIIETVGTIRDIRGDRGGRTLHVEAALPGEPLVLGESIAVSGPCLTVEEILPRGFRVFASAETLSRTTLGSVRSGTRVNLERAMRADGRLGGHIVAGHVDGIGRVRSVSSSGEAREVTIEAPPEVLPFLAAKGSVSVDGVSLTVNAVTGDAFRLVVIPHTLAATTLAGIATGTDVNLEADVVARYVARLLESRGETPGPLAARLRDMGYDLQDLGG
jgi:riboflavin synthase